MKSASAKAGKKMTLTNLFSCSASQNSISMSRDKEEGSLEKKKCPNLPGTHKEKVRIPIDLQEVAAGSDAVASVIFCQYGSLASLQEHHGKHSAIVLL